MLPADVPPGPLLVDTDVFSMVHYAKGRGADFEPLLVGHPLVLSFAAVGELRAGAIKNTWGAKRLADQARFLKTYTVVPANNDVVERYAPLHARLHETLKGGGVNDMWTAACALLLGLPIATNNLSDFQRIRSVEPQLVLVHPDL
ncbi:MAG: PIN domain-containing protein [Acidimicrobiia bacterium]